MMYSIDVNGYRAKRPITHLTDDAEAALVNFKEIIVMLSYLKKEILLPSMTVLNG